MERMAASVVAEAPAVAAVAPRPIAYRPGGEAARARDWVMALPHWSLFRLSDIPASRAVAAKTLSQLARSDPSIERVAKGFYLRGDPERAKSWTYPQLYSRVRRRRSIYGGPGSGYATVTAVNMVGWSWQASARAQVCVVGRAPRAQLPLCEFHSRSNTARRDLTWAEVSLLEALRYFDRAAGYPWRQAVETVSEGVTAIKLGAGSLIRADEVLRVGSAERGVRRPLQGTAWLISWTALPVDRPPSTGTVSSSTGPLLKVESTRRGQKHRRQSQRRQGHPAQGARHRPRGAREASPPL